MTGGSFSAFTGTTNSLSVARESISRNEGRFYNFSGYGNSTERIQREIRSQILNLPGAIPMNFICLLEGPEITSLKGGLFGGQ